jgi:YVTN family beta-propeller protein
METSDSFPAPSAIPVGYGPEGIAVDGEGRRGYVACARSDIVAVFDLDCREVVAQVPVGREPIGLVHDRERGRVFSTDARSDVV